MALAGRRLFAAAVIVAVCGGGVCAAASDQDVVATVGNYHITEQDLDSKLRAPLASLQIQVYDLKKSAVEQIADEYLLQQAARKRTSALTRI